MLNLLIKLTLQKELLTNNVLNTKTNNTTTTTKMKHKNTCWSRELNPGPLAPQADA